MNAYRIYTEDKPDNLEAIKNELKNWFLTGFNIIKTTGYWVGENQVYNEDSLMIEVFTIRSRNYMESVAERIRVVNSNQESVILVTTLAADVQFITGKD